MSQQEPEWITRLKNKYGKNANKNRNAVQAYKYLIDNFGKTAVCNSEYQDAYKDFFQTTLGGRRDTWQNQYFEFLQSLIERYKDKKPQLSDFETELDNFYTKQKQADLVARVETSYVSKALHMINHDLPIFDNNVMETLLGITRNPVYQKKTKAAKLAKANEIYQQTATAVQSVIKSPDGIGIRIIKEFKDAFKDDAIGISDVKIIDFYYWITYDSKK